jgi:hypothetical protein
MPKISTCGFVWVKSIDCKIWDKCSSVIESTAVAVAMAAVLATD